MIAHRVCGGPLHDLPDNGILGRLGQHCGRLAEIYELLRPVFLSALRDKVLIEGDTLSWRAFETSSERRQQHFEELDSFC